MTNIDIIEINILKKKFHQAIENIGLDYFNRMNIVGSRGALSYIEVERYKKSLHKNFSKNYMSYINSLIDQLKDHINNKTEFINLKTKKPEILDHLPIGIEWEDFQFEL